MHKLSHICMLHRSVNFDLTHELLLGSTPLEGRFLNNLGGSDGLGLTLYKLVTLGESSFSEEFSFDVLSIRNFSILMLDSLLDNLSGSSARLTGGHQICLAAAMLGSCAHWLSGGNTSACSRSIRLSSPMKRSLTIVIRHIF